MNKDSLDKLFDVVLTNNNQCHSVIVQNVEILDLSRNVNFMFRPPEGHVRKDNLHVKYVLFETVAAKPIT